MPPSVEVGVQEKLPAWLMFVFEIVLPLMESFTVKTGLLKPVTATVNDNVFPTGSVVPGTKPWI